MPQHHAHTEPGSHSPHDPDYSRNPLIVTWEVTQACELKCDHCRADAQPDRHPDELSSEEGRALLDQIADFGSPTPILVFSGGDPLERTDLLDLLAYARGAGLQTGVTPAPTASLTESILNRFGELGVHRIALSLDGATPVRHDTFRGEDGSFETICQAAEYASDIGLSTQINTTVTAATVDELPGIANLVESLDAVMWEVFFLVPIGRGEALEQLSPTRTREVMEWLYRRGRDAPYRVITVEAPFYRRVAHEVQRERGEEPSDVGSTGAGNGFVFVSHTGEVFPSGFMPVSAGNVRNQPLPDIYRDAYWMQQLRDRQSFEGSCGNCSFTLICGGSRSRAYAETGNPIGSDPLCEYTGGHGTPTKTG